MVSLSNSNLVVTARELDGEIKCGLQANKEYPVVGYKAGMKKRKSQKGDEYEVEEITSIIVINEKGYLKYVYPEQVKISIAQGGGK